MDDLGEAFKSARWTIRLSDRPEMSAISFFLVSGTHLASVSIFQSVSISVLVFKLSTHPKYAPTMKKVPPRKAKAASVLA